MPGSINNTGAVGGTGVTPTPPGQEKVPDGVDARDADNFASQIDNDVEEKEEAQKDELLELMKKTSFNEFSEKQKEMTEEIKKDLES